MNLEIEQIEELLHRMQPSALPSHTRARIHAAVEMHVASNPLHDAIAATRPSPLSPELSKRLEQTLSRIPHPGSGKLVHFPAKPKQTESPAWRRLAAAAAVALLGSVSAVLVPTKTGESPLAQAPNQKFIPSTAASTGTSGPTASPLASLVPAGYRKGLREAKDEGIVWQPQYGPQRRIKLVYRELVTLRDSSGRIYQVERPHTEYVLIPAKID